VALHEYQDARGQPLFWRIRCKHPDGRKWIRPLYRDGGSWRIGEPVFPTTGKPLYRLPELLAQPDAEVWIVEGETCADALRECGVLATTSGSADSAGSADWKPLAGRSVTIWPDHDDAGRRYADAVADKLRALDCVVKRIDTAPLELPEKGDAVDWRQDHPEATSDDLCALPVVSVPMSMPADSSLPQVVMTRGDQVQPVAVDWLWKEWLAAGKLHLIGGQPGTGKTTIALALAATVTLGGRWPDGTRTEPGHVVIWSGEDDPADTLVPRLWAMGADMRRVHFVDGMREGGDRYAFDPARDVEALHHAMADIPDVRMLIVDPLVSAVAGDSHKNAEVRRGLQPLVDMALKQHCVLLGVTHFSKGTAGRDPVERITGSLAFGALARVVMVAAKQEADGDRSTRRILMRAKSNIGPDGGGFAYELQQGGLSDCPGVIASSVLWGEAIEGTAREVLAEAEQSDQEQKDDTTGFLHELLRYGARPAKEIFSEAASAGFSRDAMHRAKRRIGAIAIKLGMSQGWAWRLPESEGSAEDGEGGTQNRPPSSLPSEWHPPSSEDAGMETMVICDLAPSQRTP
jgi:RecA-family ATPase